MIRIGFTGTQVGMTSLQWLVLYRELDELPRPAEFHHGDCIGADAEAHDIAVGLGLTPVIHPANGAKRAYKEAERVAPPMPPLDRNSIIVTETDRLIACPKQMTEIRRSGTWSTVRRARRASRPVMIIFPDGSVTAVL